MSWNPFTLCWYISTVNHQNRFEYKKVKIVLHGLPFTPSKSTIDGKEISLEKGQKGEKVIYSVVTGPLFKDLSVEGK